MKKKFSILIAFLVSLLIFCLMGNYAHGLSNPIETSQSVKQSCRNVEIRPTNGSLSFRRGASWQTCGYRLVFQNDGNLVLYSPRGVLWATGTERANADGFAVQRDGNVVLYGGGRPIWATNTDRNPGAFLALQTDGNLVVYASNGRQVLFATNTAGGVPRGNNAAQQTPTTPPAQNASQWRVPWPESMNPSITNSWHSDGYVSQALDFGLSAGTAIVAPTDSTVVSTCNAGLDHRAIKLRASDGQVYSMIHIRASNAQVFNGKTFRRGEQIGTIAPEIAGARLNASCARTTGPHLHLGFPTRPFTLGSRNFQ